MFRAPLLAATLALTALPAAAFEIGEMSDAERETFRAEIRAYLLDNPEVLMEAIGVLEERQAAEQAQGDVALVANHADALFNDGYSYVGGNPDGDITIVEFMDYRCGYCKKAFPEVESLIEADGNIRFIVKEFPILGEQSVVASRFAIATLQVAGPEAYKSVHDAMMQMRGDYNEAALTALAEKAGTDPAPILAAMNSDEVSAVIAENRTLAQAMQISGTPTFVLEDQMLRGYVPLQAMTNIVDEVRDAR
ncbi:DsbA family protein [Vannielia litorea]|uniref:DsbA family protein n=1 Tax=Vannielia litorea TaxID=1217970 RepID=UPI001C96D618|nr:DsbA family protein [Vannielia litorea]MBY6047139.1 DsbA family protein [Vannielia litorea]MBY6074553.1 DsbA family protein [Vannielia litorea]